MTDDSRTQVLKRQLRVELEATHQRQQSALLHLAQLPANSEMSLIDMYRSVTRTASHVLKCERASVWFFNEEHTELVCMDHYSSAENTHCQEPNWKREDFPNYFVTLETSRVLVLHNTNGHSNLPGFITNYLQPSNIGAVMHAPIWRRGRPVGVVRLEHPGSERSWELNEESFASSLADMINLLMEHHDLRETERQLRRSRDRYQLAASGVNDGIWDLHIKSQELYLSSRAQEVFGINDSESESEVNMLKLWNRVHLEDQQSVREALMAHLERQTQHFEAECRVEYSKGQYRWVLCRGVIEFSRRGNAKRMAGSISDISARKASEAVLVHEATHDALTGLPNRTFFLKRLNQTLMAEGANTRSAVFFLDVDRFKMVNDSFGHHAGDELLKVISVRLHRCLRDTDVLARLSGDEFGILVTPLGTRKDAIRMAEKIKTAFNEPIHLGDQMIYTSLSIGIAMSSKTKHVAGSLMRDADTALYKAKGDSRGSYAVFDRDMHRQAKAKMQLDTNLRTAVKKGQFDLALQPIYNVHTEELHSFEALIRWKDSKGEFVPPARFIPLAEETGLIQDIGAWVLQEACYQLSLLRGSNDNLAKVRMAVNVSPKQLLQPGFVSFVSACLSNNRLEGSDLCIEITESVLIEDPKWIHEQFNELRETGVKIHLDDFGTGYSSLSALHDFPLDSVKVDRSFIARLGDEDDSTEIVNAIIRVARSLELQVIAEGVETAAQLSTIRALGCDYGQGFLLARPTDPKLLPTHPSIHRLEAVN